MGGAALASRLMSSSHFTKCNRNSGVQVFCKMAKFSHMYLLCYIYRKEKLKGWCEQGSDGPAADAVTLNAELSACPESDGAPEARMQMCERTGIYVDIVDL